ncbi:MAG TPA: UvrD-helicase domain-containing protein [Clostridiales bacterium]|nr:UvrD-helicase domain-containing protein [Clostridiales bacterium]
MIYAHNILNKVPKVLEHFQDKYRYICVDESQDTSKIQHAIIRKLAQKHGNINSYLLIPLTHLDNHTLI